MYDNFYDNWLAKAKQVEHHLLKWEFKTTDSIIIQLKKPMQNKVHANFANAVLYYIQGIDYQRRGLYREGGIKLQNALQLIDAYLEKSSSKARSYLKLKILYCLGNCEIEMDNQLIGYDYLMEAKQLLEHKFAGYKIDKATLYLHLGTYHGINGHYDQQKNFCKKALKIVESLSEGNNLLVADCYEFLGYCEANLGNYSASEKHHYKCLAIREKFFPKKHPAIGKCINNQGFLLRKKAQYHKVPGSLNEALNLHLKALEFFKDADYKHHLIFRIIFNLAKVYKELEVWDKAFDQYQKVKELREEAYGKQHRHVASTLLNIGRCHAAFKQFDKAIEHFKKSLKIREAIWVEVEHRYTAKCHYELSVAYLQEKKYVKALEHANNSLRINNQVFRSEFNEDIAADRNLIAAITAGLKNYNVAKKLVGENLKNEETLPKEIRIKSYEILGEIHFLEGKFEKAQYFFLSSLKLKNLGKDDSDSTQARLFNWLGKCLLQLGEFKSALAYFQEAIVFLCPNFSSRNVFRNPPNIKNPTSYINGFALIDAMHNKIKCSICLYKENERKRNFRALALSTFWEASILMENALNMVNSGTKLELLNEEKGISEDIINLLYNQYSESPKRVYATQAFFLAEQRKGILLSKSQSNNSRPKFSNSNHFKDPKWFLKEIRKQLGNASSLLEYFVGEKTTFLFHITKRNIDFIKLPGPELGESQLAKYCDEFAAAFENWNRKDENNTLQAKQHYLHWATKLYKLLISPVKTLDTKDIKQLILIPDGPLFKISFAALIKPIPNVIDIKKVKDFPFLLKDHLLYYQYSAKSLLDKINPQAWIKDPDIIRAVVIAPSYFNNDRNLKRLDVRPIYRLHRQYLDELIELTGKKATLKNIKTHLPYANYILGYSHCKKDENGELHILLTEGQKMKLSDLQTMTCSAALVLLICCGGGVGPLQGREGMFSFSRAFLEAGAQNVCSSLSTKVFDDAARQLLEELVQRTFKKIDNTQALRDAQLQLLKFHTHFLPIDILSFVIYGK